MITVCCFLWSDKTVAHKARYQYGVEDVIAVKRGVDKHLSLPHEFVVVTDSKEDFGPGIRVVQIDYAKWVDGTRFVKLMLFRPDIASVLGGRILYLDLDSVIVGNLNQIVNRSEDLVLWRNPNFGVPKRAFYNTSIMLIRAGSRTEFWSEFDPKTTPAMLRQKWGGTDQAWISHRASREEAHWSASDGIYGAGRLGDIAPGAGTALPENAKVVFFPGNRHLSQTEVLQKHPWIVGHRN